MVRRRDFSLLSMLFPVVTGCAPEPQSTKALRAIGLTYALPRGWTHEDAEDKGAVFMLSPEISGGVAATAMIELPKMQNPQDIPRLLRDQSEELGRRYPNYAELRLESKLRIGQNFFGLLEYTATRKKIPLTEQYMLLGFRKKETLLVFTSIATDVKSQYLATVQELVASIRIATQ